MCQWIDILEFHVCGSYYVLSRSNFSFNGELCCVTKTWCKWRKESESYFLALFTNFPQIQRFVRFNTQILVSVSKDVFSYVLEENRFKLIALYNNY